MEHIEENTQVGSATAVSGNYLHVCMYPHVCMFVCIHMYVCMYVCMYDFLFVSTCTYVNECDLAWTDFSHTVILQIFGALKFR